MSDVSDIVRLQDALGGRYEVQRELGHGAFATVFLARDLRHDRPVAIKVLRADPSTEENEIRFTREIGFLARLQHPNILPLHDSGHVLDMLYYVVPFVQGMSLRDRIDRDRQLPIDDAVCIARELADALEYAHHQGVIHRDIKPENILLSGSHAVLADFGVARAATAWGARRLTKSGPGGPGTPAYMSPEQILGDQDVDTRSDIYSLGCVLYEMLAGKPPFSGAGGFVRRFTELAPPVSSARRDVPASVDQAIAKALARQPADRFASAGELGVALTLGNTTRASPVEPRRNIVLVSSAPVIGREREIAELKTLLEERRFVTLLGPGGVGKTRLAAQVAHDLGDEYRHGSHLVPLIAVSSTDLAPSAIADVLGLRFSGQQDSKTQLLEALRERHLLLVLDSFEHLVAGAALVAEIVQHAQNVRVLVTSRERLNITDETTLEIHGLAITRRVDAKNDEQPAVRLFLDLVRRSDPHFTLSGNDQQFVDRICSLMGGLPLGIALAASMVRVLSCREIAEELERDVDTLTTSLRDVPERHRSLRAVFDQSWALLGDAERSALMRLSVLRGGFRRDAGTYVGAAPLSTLGSLVDKSLIQRSASGRFEIHDVVRQFSELRLKDQPNVWQSAEDARSEWFARYLHEREVRLVSQDLYATLDEIAEHIESIRAGWQHAIERGRDDLVADYAFGLYRFYAVRGRYEEGDAVFALAEHRQTQDRLAALLLTRRAYFTASKGDFGAARALCRRSVEILRRDVPQTTEMGITLATVAFIAMKQGKYRAASRLFGIALRILRSTGPEWELGVCLANWAGTQTTLGAYDDAESSFLEAIAIFTHIGDPRANLAALSNMSNVLAQQGRLVEAQQVRQQVVDLARELNDPYMIAASLINLGHSYVRLEQYAEARSLVEQSLEYFRSVGRPDGICWGHFLLGRIARAFEDYALAEEQLRDALRLAAQLDDTARIMEIFTEMAQLRLVRHEVARAARLATVASHHSATPKIVRREATALLDRIVIDFSESERGGPADMPNTLDHREIVRDLLNSPEPTDKSS
jgi:predicted ATPase/tetratricopeptide (TPR) repeat protein